MGRKNPRQFSWETPTSGTSSTLHGKRCGHRCRAGGGGEMATSLGTVEVAPCLLGLIVKLSRKAGQAMFDTSWQ